MLCDRFVWTWTRENGWSWDKESCQSDALFEASSGQVSGWIHKFRPVSEFERRRMDALMLRTDLFRATWRPKTPKEAQLEREQENEVPPSL